MYWLADKKGEYSGLNEMPASKLTITAKRLSKGKIAVILVNPNAAPVAFLTGCH
ncbi:hypothetical protein [Mucilaginibacter antarcticus]|uniref:hypothetical protein n=1 Tax=Mucilaginibacter antarcticus TaxID=1855725 RepID=UPI0036280A20